MSKETKTKELSNKQPLNIGGVGDSGDYYSITLKGIIVFSLGGFSGEGKGLSTIKNSEKVVNGITEYCNKHKMAIVPINGELELVPLNNKNPWWRFW
tara:strand:- start:54 stop:344 length:291 start_codon:yes stop_codon:yes gene_type:complete